MTKQLKELQNTFLEACKNGELDTVKYLSSQFMILNAVEELNRNALILACKYQHFGIVEFLVNTCKMDVNVQDADGRTPLIMATYDDDGDSYFCEENGSNIITFLLDHGADIHITDYLDRTAFLNAAHCWESEDRSYKNKIIRILVERGANIHDIDYEGRNALHISSDFNASLSIVTFLLEMNQLDVNAQDKDGYTPLMIASIAGNKDIVHILLHYGANINQQCKNGWTALMYAEKYKCIDVIEILNTKKRQ